MREARISMGTSFDVKVMRAKIHESLEMELVTQGHFRVEILLG